MTSAIGVSRAIGASGFRSCATVDAASVTTAIGTASVRIATAASALHGVRGGIPRHGEAVLAPVALLGDGHARRARELARFRELGGAQVHREWRARAHDDDV